MIPHEVSAPRVSAFPRSACGGTAPPPFNHNRNRDISSATALARLSNYSKIMLVVLGLNQRFLTLSPQEPSRQEEAVTRFLNVHGKSGGQSVNF